MYTYFLLVKTVSMLTVKLFYLTIFSAFLSCIKHIHKEYCPTSPTMGKPITFMLITYIFVTQKATHPYEFDTRVEIRNIYCTLKETVMNHKHKEMSLII